MHSTSGLLLALLVAICCQAAVMAMFNRCSCGDTCIDIRECGRFAPHFSEPAKWSAALKDDFRKRVCQRETGNGATVFKVCCPKSPKTPPAGGWKRRIDLLDLEGCGAYSEDRIAFGDEAKLFQYPWMALLRSQGLWTCGGTLINAQYVLTAAHCVRNIEMEYVRVGEFDLNQPIDCDKRGELCALAPQDIRVARSIIHENYSSRCRLNDIALLRLATPASLNDNVLPICLPVSPAMRTTLPSYYVAGWGTTETGNTATKLLFTAMRLMDRDECQTELRREDEYVSVFDSQLCAIGTKSLSDNCLGDSGGPLKTASVTGRYVQYGVVSFGLKSCGTKAAPGVYTKVEDYVDWILDKLEP